jgi:Arm DNA-binding domain
MTNAERARRYIARLKTAARAPSPTVCPHCGGSLLAEAKAGSDSPPEPGRKAPRQASTIRSGTEKRPNLTDTDVPALAPGRYAVARGLLLWVGKTKKTFQYHRSTPGQPPFYKTMGHWPNMTVAQARAEAGRLNLKSRQRA